MLGQIATEVEILQKHITLEEPDLEFIITHAQSLLELAVQLADNPIDDSRYRRDSEKSA
jgi:hypothetical protein